MINAREEFENTLRIHTLGDDTVQELDVWCAWIAFIRPDMGNAVYLKKGHSPAEYEEFLCKIDRDYDDGFGTRELFGMIWLKNGEWFERSDYDGNEEWEHCTVPSTPKECEGPLVKSAMKK